MLSSLEQLNHTGNSKKCKILITCRRKPDIGRTLGDVSTTFAVDTGKVNTNFCEFISFKFDEISKPSEWTPNLKKIVSKTYLSTKPGGLSYGLFASLKSLKIQIKTNLKISMHEFDQGNKIISCRLDNRLHLEDLSNTYLQRHCVSSIRVENGKSMWWQLVKYW